MKRRESIVAISAIGVLAGPIRALAQRQGKVWRVGFLSLQHRSDTIASKSSAAFLKGMRDLGYVEGGNLQIEWRFAEGNAERLLPLAEELVRLRVDVIVAHASPAIGAAKKATATIPIVMATTGDPVGSGFVNSLARPGGNITGLSNMGGDLAPKLLDLLLSVVPHASRVAVLVSHTSTTYRRIAEGAQSAAQKIGVKTLVVEASSPQEIESAFSTMVHEHADGMLVGEAAFLTLQRQQIADLALKHRIPSVSGNPLIVEAGGLMSYGTKFAHNFVRSASYVDKILKGSKPGDLPVEQSTTLELVVNLRTAKALGITIPQTILLRADEVVQ